MEKEQKENIKNQNLAKEENDQSTKPQDQTEDRNKKKKEDKKGESAGIVKDDSGIATVLVKKGTLNVGDIFLCGAQSSRVRALLNERNMKIDKALPSDPVQILGFEKVPNSGEEFIVMPDVSEARNIAQKRAQLKREAEQRRFRKVTLDHV